MVYYFKNLMFRPSNGLNRGKTIVYLSGRLGEGGIKCFISQEVTIYLVIICYVYWYVAISC